MKFIMMCFSIIILSGCGSNISLISMPKKGTISISNVGESMYTYHYGHFNRRASLQSTRDNIYYGINPQGVRFDPLDGHQCALHMRNKSLFDYNCDGYLTHDRKGNRLSRPIKYKLFPQNNKSSSILSHQILYQGRIGKKIKVSYREFINNLARSSFTQDIEYQLDSRGKADIGIKGIRIKVLKATNMEIKYKVIKEFN